MKSGPVFTSHRGDNSRLIAEVARLYLQPGMTVADVTYGNGVFWRKVDLAGIEFCPSDIETGTDFRALAYAADSVDVLVLDPPYAHAPGVKFQVDSTYRNRATTEGLNHVAIIALYREGMTEARRVLRPGGQLWIKCQDEIEHGCQKWSHIELHAIACELGFTAQDFFVLTRPNATVRVPRQLHARKNHSYLWVFRKGKDAQT